MTNNDILDKIAKVFKMAENASTPEEAESFMSKAQFLASQYSIDLAVARARLATKEQREVPTIRRVKVADSSLKTKKWMVELFGVIAENNDLKYDITYDSSKCVSYGFAGDIDVAEAMFAHLSTAMVQDADKWLATKEYKKETVTVWSDSKYAWVTKPIDGRVARANFYRNYIHAVGRRLRSARLEAKEAAMKAEEEKIELAKSLGSVESDTVGTELVLMDKSEEVYKHYKASSKARGSWGGPSVSGLSGAASAAGRAAGEKVNIGGARSISGAGRAIGS